MADIIDIRGRIGRRAAAEREREDGGAIYRVRLCGPDLRWIGLVGGILGRALNLEGFYVDFEDPDGLPALPPAVICLRAGREVITERGMGRCPGLIVAAPGALSDGALHGADGATVLLVDAAEPEVVRKRSGFPGTIVPLPVAATAPEPLGIPVACAGGAARLLGVVRWTALEQALREELGIFDHAAVHRCLAMALEAFDRTAPWAGRVPAVREEVG